MAGSPMALSQLRKELVSSANKFGDYNFRSYFVKWAGDKCDGVQAQGADAVAAFEKEEGPRELARMQRMAAVNAMFAEVPVVVEKKGEQ